MFEKPHVEALKALDGDSGNFFFMQLPPRATIESIIFQLKPQKERQQQEATLIDMITNNKNNFFFSEKIKEKFDGNFDDLVKSIVDEAMSKFGGVDLYNVLNEINARLTAEIQQKVQPDSMCMVCKDGIDRGHAAKLNLLRYMQHNNQDERFGDINDIDIDTRAQLIAGRRINANGETVRKYIAHEQLQVECPQRGAPGAAQLHLGRQERTDTLLQQLKHRPSQQPQAEPRKEPPEAKI